MEGKVPVFVTKSQLGHQLLSYPNWVLFLKICSNLVFSVKASLTTLTVCHVSTRVFFYFFIEKTADTCQIRVLSRVNF